MEFCDRIVSVALRDQLSMPRLSQTVQPTTLKMRTADGGTYG